MAHERMPGRSRVPQDADTLPELGFSAPGAAIMRIQRLAGNAAVGRALDPSPEQIAQLQGDENYLGVKVGITPDLLEMLTQPTSSADKDLVPAAKGATFELYDGQESVKDIDDENEVDPGDVKQGLLGDCYLCAAMIAVARANPGKIASMIDEQDDGTYNVTLNLKAGVLSKDGGPQVINVDASFPTKNGVPVYVKEGDVTEDGSPELWPMLIEKAYAKAKGGYTKIQSGNAGDAAAMIGGGKSKEHWISSMSAEKIADLIDEALKKEWPVICVTAPDKGEKPTKTEDRENLDIVANHAYPAKAVSADKKTVELQNPWGKKHLKIDIDGPFKKYFIAIDVVKP
jgi:hypothetical protein